MYENRIITLACWIPAKRLTNMYGWDASNPFTPGVVCLLGEY